MSHQHPHRREPLRAPDQETAAEQVLDEFHKAETDPEHRRRAERRRGEAGDTLTPSQHAQEQTEGE